MSKLNIMKMVINNLKLAYKYLKDGKVSFFKKILLIFPLVYIISPVDLIPDLLIPVLGWMDDTVIALTVWNYMFNIISTYEEQNSDEEYVLDDDEYKIE